MNAILKRIFLVNWPRKLVALISALIIWFLINQSLTVTKSYPNIAVRVINLPQDKTVSGLLANGQLSKRVSIILTGNKRILEELDDSDMEILINANGKEESFVVKIDKRNLHLLTKDDNFKSDISHVRGDDIFIKITNYVTEEIPIIIHNPLGTPPPGFQFLDVFPKHILQKVSGPQEEVELLKKKGIELTFDLDKITKEELDEIKKAQTNSKSEVISFFIPTSWKKVIIPFRNYLEEPLNDPRAHYLRIDFLKNELIPLKGYLPLILFFPVKHSDTLNPQTYHFEKSSLIEEKNGLSLLNKRLYVQGVSRHFLDIVKEKMGIMILVTPKSESAKLDWNLFFADEKALERAFIAACSNEKEVNEEMLKQRFRFFINSLQLFVEKEIPLQLNFTLDDDEILIHE